MIWQSPGHVGAAAVVQFRAVSQPGDSGELAALQ